MSDSSEPHFDSPSEVLSDAQVLSPPAGDFLAVHPDVVAKVQENLPDDEILYDLAELFRVFGDSTRIKILYVLFESELCVGDIAQLLSLSQSSVSHQLRLLKNAKLVKFRRDGKAVFYSLDDDHVRTMIALGMEHVEE
jgi:ArsR family transcriptional regulator